MTRYLRWTVIPQNLGDPLRERTSARLVAMNPTLFEIERVRPGRLATMACPRGGDWLADEMAGLRAKGVNALVSALTDSELVELRLASEPELARQAGLTFVSFPIPDRDVPAATEPVTELVCHLEGLLAAGQFVCVHCRGGYRAQFTTRRRRYGPGGT